MQFILSMLRVFRAHFSPVKCSETIFHKRAKPWLHIGGLSADPIQSANSTQCLRNVSDTYLQVTTSEFIWNKKISLKKTLSCTGAILKNRPVC